MPGPGRDEYGVTDFDGVGYVINFHGAAALENEIKFFRQPVVVAFGSCTLGKGGLSQALVGNRGIGGVEDAADRRAVLGCERYLFG